MINLKIQKRIFTDFLIGSDCEMILLDKNGVLFADDNCEEPEGEFGADGSGIPFEIRPAPSYCPIEHVSNIHQIFVNQINKNRKFLNYKWMGGSCVNGHPIGGHVHFSLKNDLIPPNEATKILDNYLGAIVLLIENRGQGIERRIDNGYGRFMDYRTKSYGFEARSFGSWLTNPHVALAVLCLGKTIMSEAINNPYFAWNEFVTKDEFNMMKTSEIRKKFPLIWADIKKMNLFKKYKSHINVLHFLINNKLSWFSSFSLKESWGIIDNSLPLRYSNLQNIWKKQNF